MNLSAADTAIYFSEPVGYMARKQTEDRILDTEKKSTLLYIHLLVENSIDEDIRMALKMKNWASNLLLSRAIKGAMYARLQNRVQ